MKQGVERGAGARRQSQVRSEGKTASFLDGRGPGPRASGLASISSSALTAMQEMSEAGSPTRGTRGPCPPPFTRARCIPTQTHWKLTAHGHTWYLHGAGKDPQVLICPSGPSSALHSPPSASLLPASRSALLDAVGQP